MTDLPPPGAAPNDDQPGIRILAQYIRDLSFESPHAPESLRGGAAQPQMDLGVELNARGRPDGYYEVELKLTARASRDTEAVFMVELLYARPLPDPRRRRRGPGSGADDRVPPLPVPVRAGGSSPT